MMKHSRALVAVLLAAFVLGLSTVSVTVRHEESARAKGRKMPTADGMQEPLQGSSAGGADHRPPSVVIGDGGGEQITRSSMTLAARAPRGGRKNGAHGRHLTKHNYAHGGKKHKHKRKEGVMDQLRSEFETWADTHKRKYGSHEERERRFGIWAENHHKTIEKNEKHGPCKLTSKQVFGDNHFKDLTSEEWQARYLTGYGGPRTDKLPKQHRDRRRIDEAVPRDRRRTSTAAAAEPVGEYQKRSTADAFHDPLTAADRHPSVQSRYEEHILSQTSSGLSLAGALQERTYVGGRCGSATADSNCYRSESSSGAAQSGFSWYSCKWYDVSCWLRVIFTGSAYGGSSEPEFDGSNYPEAMDWRELGAVTDVHSQGQCGACWAITAVETIESAYFIKSGSLIDLAESEVIVCDYTCALCDGGWPQNAYDYVMKYNGLPEEQYWQYNGDWLMSLTYFATGQSDELSEDYVGAYLEAQCPTGNWMEGGGESESQSDSGDNNEEVYYDGEYLSSPRYGQIKNYAYTTDRCICYTDGTGCECDEQNEKRALMNVASYGPATVCLDAAVWQDYDGGILTSDSGCSSDFLEMNHCVQAVGYAFTDGTEADVEDGQQQQDSGSGSGSGDDADRVGYWIIRNQWSDAWGMNGYIYVAMGENTCGVLNDMTQAFS